MAASNLDNLRGELREAGGAGGDEGGAAGKEAQVVVWRAAEAEGDSEATRSEEGSHSLRVREGGRTIGNDAGERLGTGIRRSGWRRVVRCQPDGEQERGGRHKLDTCTYSQDFAYDGSTTCDAPTNTTVEMFRLSKRSATLS